MKKIKFIKMHGAGNDFVFISSEHVKAGIGSKQAQLLLDRHFGVGGDQLLVLSDEKLPHPSLQIFNSDGSQAEMCGNGVRAAAFYLKKFRGIKRNFQFKTRAGLIGIGFSGDKIEVNMGPPILEGTHIPVKARGPVVNRMLKVGSKNFRIHAVSMGNPHCIVFVKNVDTFPVGQVGPQIERHPFFPRRVNVEFVQVLSPSHVRARVWERGAGETLACGTGACAIAVAAARIGKTKRQIKIDLPGGQLGARWGTDNHVYLTGPAEVTYQGEFFLKD